MTESNQQAQAYTDHRSKARKTFDAAWASVKRQTYLLYCRTLYRPHMRAIHRFGWHWRTYLHPIDGLEQHWCQWCGDRRVIALGEGEMKK